MTRPFTIEEWSATHPRWHYLVRLMEAEEQADYWEQEEHFAQFTHYFLVALQGDELLGFLQFFLQPMGPDRDCPLLYLHGMMLIEAKIIAFGVRKEWRRYGVGRALQERAISRARELGCHQLRSYSSNEPAHAANYQLKLAMGFGAQPEFRGEGNTGVNFIMPLRSDLTR